MARCGCSAASPSGRPRSSRRSAGSCDVEEEVKLRGRLRRERDPPPTDVSIRAVELHGDRIIKRPVLLAVAENPLHGLERLGEADPANFLRRGLRNEQVLVLQRAVEDGARVALRGRASSSPGPRRPCSV
jgi:hypothetical protein